MTIDPADAKDFDDALSLQKLPLLSSTIMSLLLLLPLRQHLQLAQHHLRLLLQLQHRSLRPKQLLPLGLSLAGRWH